MNNYRRNHFRVRINCSKEAWCECDPSVLFHRLTHWNKVIVKLPADTPSPWWFSTVLRLVPGGAATLVVPDVVSVFGSAEQPGRLGQALPVLPLPVSFPARFGEQRTAAKLGGGVGSVVMETRRGQLTSRWPGNAIWTWTNEHRKGKGGCSQSKPDPPNGCLLILTIRTWSLDGGSKKSELGGKLSTRLWFSTRCMWLICLPLC